MSILLAYNESDSWEVGKLAKATEIKEDLLVQVNRKYGVNVVVFCSSNCKVVMSSFITLSPF